MTDSGWLHYRDLKSRCPVCKRPAHIAKRNGNFYFVDDEYNPFVRLSLNVLPCTKAWNPYLAFMLIA